MVVMERQQGVRFIVSRPHWCGLVSNNTGTLGVYSPGISSLQDEDCFLVRAGCCLAAILLAFAEVLNGRVDEICNFSTSSCVN